MKYSLWSIFKTEFYSSENLVFGKLLNTIHFKFFFLGLFLLLSAPSIAGIFIFIALIIAKFKKEERKYTNVFANLFYLSGAILILSTIITSFDFNATYSVRQIEFNLESWAPLLHWIGLFNWLPFLFFFSEFQYFLKTKQSRKQASLFLISGSFPLIITAFGQYYFNWNGPFIFAGGLIKWFQRPIIEGGATGLFNNENYAGTWLLTIWPLSVAYLLEIKNKFTTRKLFICLITFLIFFTILLTKSRNSIMGTIISLPFLMSKIMLFWYLPFLLVIIFTVSLFIFPIFSTKLTMMARNIIPEIFISKLNYIDIYNLLEIPRISLWINSIKYIIERPFWGWGAATFPILYSSRTSSEKWFGHTHNIFLEVSYNYGLLASISLAIPIIIILKKSFEKIYLKRSDYKNKTDYNLQIFEKSWWTSTFCLLINQQFDMQYYDLRISIVLWVLLAGLASSYTSK